MESRGYVVHGAGSVSEGIKLGKSVKPAYAVVDMRLEDGNGLMWWKICALKTPMPASSC